MIYSGVNAAKIDKTFVVSMHPHSALTIRMRWLMALRFSFNRINTIVGLSINHSTFAQLGRAVETNSFEFSLFNAECFEFSTYKHIKNVNTL